ncbi:hypothetical protein GCM10011521_02420 [Arenimonas soli]|uniref:Sel1 repeat family protein n=1 Tax=Arenimonas soli TaxID=2269504 RepID=A0ABQ1HBD5_9GAMM|nr:hypothetical protein [Arenimonas soli]GGA67813.1 hypothetical protein GCM10011521_02420 [Arenimonas soli]
MNRHRRALLLLALAAALAGLAWFGMQAAEQQPGRPAAVTAAQLPERDAGPAGEDDRAADRGALPPLPAQDLPFSQALPDLLARADAGDARAACRLGHGLLRCQHSARWNKIIGRLVGRPDLETEYERRGDLAAANRVAAEELWRLEVARDCDLLPASLHDQGSRYLREAALDGDPEAMLAYGLGHQWNPGGRGVAAGSDFDTWRNEAPGMLQRALRAGHPAAAFALASAYGDDFGFPSVLVPNDDYRAAVYHLLSVALFGQREDRRLLQRLDASAQVAARGEARRLHVDVFDERTFGGEHAFLQPPFLKRPDDMPAPCELPQ